MKRNSHYHEGLPPRFTCLGLNNTGTTTCMECGAEVGLDEAFNTYFDIFDRIVEAFEEAQIELSKDDRKLSDLERAERGHNSGEELHPSNLWVPLVGPSD